MGIIDQLGGYNTVKRMWIDGGSLQDTQLAFELLEYRREHNIFEVGDDVVETSRYTDDRIYKIKEDHGNHNFCVGSDGAQRDFWTLFKYEIRHATHEEIQAGRRL